MAFFYLLTILGLPGLLAASECRDIPVNYTKTLPYDFGPHLDYTYEYWFYVGYLTPSSNSHNKSFGFMFGPTRCSEECSPQWNASSFNLAVTIAVPDENVVLRDIIYYESPNDDTFINISPFEIKLNSYSLKSTDPKGNWNTARLTGKLHGAYLDLTLEDHQRKNSLFYESLLINYAGIHFDQNYIQIRGNITYHDVIYEVQGVGFNDHYWSNVSCNFITGGTWKWFMLTLDNGFQLLFTEIISPYHIFKDMMYIFENGTHYQSSTFVVTVTEWWTSPRSKHVYPIHNLLTGTTPGLDFLLKITPLVDDNELYFQGKPIIYEGTSTVSGFFNGKKVTGVATTELKGF